MKNRSSSSSASTRCNSAGKRSNSCGRIAVPQRRLFVTSIPAYFTLYARVRDNPTTPPEPARPHRERGLGAVLELILIIANVGTAVVPYAVFKRYSEGLVLGYVAARLVEAHSSPSGSGAYSRSCSCGRKARLAQTPLSARLSSRSMIGRSDRARLLRGRRERNDPGYLMYRPAWCHEAWRCWGSSEVRWSPPRESPSCSMSSSAGPRCRASRRFRSSSGSRR